MTEHPEFPQESPATKYIVEQVSKIEDAQACGTGYYNSLKKVLSRLDKTDIAIVQLKQAISEYEDKSDSRLIAAEIKTSSDNLAHVTEEHLKKISASNVKALDERLTAIEEHHKKLLLAELESAMKCHSLIRETSDRMSSIEREVMNHIVDVENRITPPLWQQVLCGIVILVVGVVIGIMAARVL